MPKKTGPKISPHVRGGFYTTLTAGGVKKFLYGNNEDEVKRKYIEALYLYGQGYNIGDNPTMRDYAVSWFNIFKKGRGAIKTREMYMNAVNVHVIPALGTKRIKDITTSDVQQLLNQVVSSKSLQHKIRITLNQIFKKAQADRLVAFNPVTGTEPVATADPLRQCYTPAQRELMLKILSDHKIFPLAFTILNTGLRLTEAIALMRKRDLDLEKRKIFVRESTEFIKSQPGQKNTKTKRGAREIPIPSSFAAWLEDYLAQAQKSLYVFPGHHGGQMGQTELKNMQRKANAKVKKWFDDNRGEEDSRFRLHFKTLRHTYCTELYDLEVDELSAAAIMGHTVAIMREIYTHIQKERKEQTVVKIEGLYNRVIELPKNKDTEKSS